MDENPSPSLKTPVAGAKSTLSEVTVIDMDGSPQTNKLEAVDLDIKNLEGTPQTRHKKAASVSGSPSSKTKTHVSKCLVMILSKFLDAEIQSRPDAGCKCRPCSVGR